MKQLYFFAFLLFLSSCSLTRSVPEGRYLYLGAEAKIDKPDGVKTTELEAQANAILQQQQPNKKFLGIRWGLRFYNLFYTQKEKGLSHWLANALGNPPVLYDETKVESIEELLENKAFNLGFFHADVTHDPAQKKKKIKSIYRITTEQPFIIENMSIDLTDSLIQNIILRSRPESLTKMGQPYHLLQLKTERERMATELKKNGYYYFRGDYMKYVADTLDNDQQIQMSLQLKQDAPAKSLRQQYLHHLFVKTNTDIYQNIAAPTDTIDYEGLEFILPKNIDADVLRNAIVLQKNRPYSITTHQRTLEKLSALNNFRFIDIQFEPVDNSDTLLNVVVSLTPRKKHLIEGSLGAGLTFQQHWGPELTAGYTNRNSFGGAEIFNVQYTGNYNYALNNFNTDYTRQNITVSFTKPGLITPFYRPHWQTNLIASTTLKFEWDNGRYRIPLEDPAALMENGFPGLAQQVGLDSTFAPRFSVNNFDLSLTYAWRKKRYVQHEFSPVNANLQRPGYEVAELRRLLRSVIIFSDVSGQGNLLNLERIFGFKPNYVFLLDTRLKQVRTHNIRYRTKFSLSGNWILGGNGSALDDRRASQFFQIEQDFRYYWNFAKNQTLAYRFTFNYSIPLRNSVLLPFIDLYEVGGPNSLRAFRPRGLGPGSVEPQFDQNYFFSGKGNVLLETNLEWRPQLSSLFELGFFIDAGNVWLVEGELYDAEQEVVFRPNRFYKQLGIGPGMGIRLNFTVLLLRLDVGFPLTKPWLPEGERWVGDKVALGSRAWRQDNLQFQLNFGYAF